MVDGGADVVISKRVADILAASRVYPKKYHRFVLG